MTSVKVQTEIKSGKYKWVWGWCGGPIHGEARVERAINVNIWRDRGTGQSFMSREVTSSWQNTSSLLVPWATHCLFDLRSHIYFLCSALNPSRAALVDCISPSFLANWFLSAFHRWRVQEGGCRKKEKEKPGYFIRGCLEFPVSAL